MARILFTVCGVGLGHCMRSMPLIDYLQKEGHEIVLSSYGESQKFLKKKFSKVGSLKWFDLLFDKDQYRRTKTILYNLPNAPRVIASNFLNLLGLVREFRPDVIVSDFDFNSSLVGFMQNIPVILLSNMHMMEYNPIEMSVKDKIDYAVKERPIIHGFPRIDALFVLGFVRPRSMPKKARFFFQPVRKEVLEKKPLKKGFFLVYLSDGQSESLLAALKRFRDKKFVAIGAKPKHNVPPNFRFKQLDQESFAKDLAECNGVISHGGISLMCESLYLGKPVYTFTSKSFFERYYNGKLVEENGMGLLEEEPSFEGLGRFFSRLSEFEEKIEKNGFVPGGEALKKELSLSINELAKKHATAKNASPFWNT
ncbi:MAG: hypothetical protein HY392_01955 [Candidatus Diapherotrites archaeon]|nr:hypothetical protein [Candidatus Diapherotrites archaeon]